MILTLLPPTDNVLQRYYLQIILHTEEDNISVIIHKLSSGSLTQDF